MSRVNISTLNIKISASSSGLAQQVNQAVGQVQKLNNGIKQQNKGLVTSVREFEEILARSLLLYSTFKGISFAKDQLFDSVRLAAEAESAAISFEVLLGSAADAQKIVAGLYKFVETTPFRLDEVRRAAKSLAAYGVENDKIIPTLRALGDVAAATGNDFFELAEVYGRTRVEQRLYTKDLNQFTSRGIPLIQIFAKQFGVVESQVRKMAEEGKLSFDDVERAFASLTGAGGKFFGLTQRQAQTTAGEFSNFLDEVDALKREFGTGMLPTLSEFLALLREVITGGNQATTTLEKFRQAGEDTGIVLRKVAAGFQLARATLAAFDALLVLTAKNLLSVGGLLESDAAKFLEITEQSLARQAKELGKSADLLWDTERSIREALSQRTVENSTSLSTMIGGVADDVQRARNQLKLLTEDSKKFLEVLRQKYITPMQEFEAAVRGIIKADLLTDASDSEIASFLAGEVDRLNEATQNLKNTLQENPAAFKDSVEAVSAQLRALMGSSTVTVGGESPEQVIERLRTEVMAEIEAMKAGTDATNQNTSAIRELTDVFKNVNLLSLQNSPRWSIGPDGNPVMGPSSIPQLPKIFTEQAPVEKTMRFVDSLKAWADSWLKVPREAVDALRFTNPRSNRRKEAAAARAAAREAASRAALEDAEIQRQQMLEYASRQRNRSIGDLSTSSQVREPMGPQVPQEIRLFREQLSQLRNLASGVSDILGASPTEQQRANYAYSQFQRARDAALESGQSIDAEVPGLLQALIDELKSQQDSPPTSDASPSKDVTPSAPANEDTAAEIQKLKQEVARLSASEQTLLTQIASSTAATARQRTIVVREFAA